MNERQSAYDTSLIPPKADSWEQLKGLSWFKDLDKWTIGPARMSQVPHLIPAHHFIIHWLTRSSPPSEKVAANKQWRVSYQSCLNHLQPCVPERHLGLTHATKAARTHTSRLFRLVRMCAFLGGLMKLVQLRKLETTTVSFSPLQGVNLRNVLYRFVIICFE